jgi:putative ABC transport system permease protein
MTAIRLALRGLRKSPWVAGSIVAVLAVGITLTTVTFAVAERILFRPLPYDRPDELFVLRAATHATQAGEVPPVSAYEIEAWMKAVPEVTSTTISAELVAYPLDGLSTTMAMVDRRFFDVLGIRLPLGGFSEEDYDSIAGEFDTHSVRPVLVSHRLWRSAMGGDPHVLGETRVISERGGRLFAFRIAGVLPRGFVFPVEFQGRPPDFLTPIARRSGLETKRELHLVARVPPSISMASVNERLSTATSDLARSPLPPDPHAAHGEAEVRAPFNRVALAPLDDWLGGRQRVSARLLFYTAIGLLLLACFNAGSLAAARNRERREQLLLCRALGASIGDLAKLHFVEIGVLTTVAGTLALLAAKPALVGTLALLPESMVFGEPPSLDVRVVAGSVLLAVVSALLVVAWPLYLASRVGLPVLGRRATVKPVDIGHSRRKTRGLGVAIQAGCGFVFVIGGVLTVASLGAAISNDVGYHRDRMMLVQGSVRRYIGQDDARQQLEDSVERLRNLPAVDRVAVSTLQSTFLRDTAIPTPVTPEGWSRPADQATVRHVSHDFFDVMGLRLIAGRWPTPLEWSSGSSTAIVSMTAARAFWPDGAIGRKLTVRRAQPPLTVVAIVADARFVSLDVEPTQDVYLPDPIARGRTGLLYHVRTAESAERALPLVIRELSANGIRVDRASTHTRGLFDGIKDRALPAWLFGLLAVAALVILAIGVAGRCAMVAAERTREVGIRLALGSTRSEVVKTLLSGPLAALLDGLIVGGLVSWWLVTFLDSQLYGVRSHHPGLWALAAALIAVVAIASGAVPAIRASRLSAVEALRTD